jgi:hypothetical protein
MMTGLISISKAGPHTVPQPRATDAIGTVLRHAFRDQGLTDEWTLLLHRIDRSARG